MGNKHFWHKTLLWKVMSLIFFQGQVRLIQSERLLVRPGQYMYKLVFLKRHEEFEKNCNGLLLTIFFMSKMLISILSFKLYPFCFTDIVDVTLIYCIEVYIKKQTHKKVLFCLWGLVIPVRWMVINSILYSLPINFFKGLM